MSAALDVFDAAVPPLATAAAIGTYAGSLLDSREWRAHGTGAMSHIPLCMLCANAAGWIVYGVLLANASMMVANVVGLAIALYLLHVYNACSPAPFSSELLTHAAFLLAYMALVALYAFATRDASTVGTVASLVTIAMFASPLATVQTVIKTKSAESLPAPMIIVGLACTTLWLAYGVRLGDIFVYGPNSVAFVLGLFQVGLLIVYRKGKGNSALPL